MSLHARMYQSWHPALAHRQQGINVFRGIMTRPNAVDGNAIMRDSCLLHLYRRMGGFPVGLMALPVACHVCR
jgi:hypothetical protein